MKLRKMWGDPKVNGNDFDPDVFYHKRRDGIAETPFYIFTLMGLKTLAKYFWKESAWSEADNDLFEDCWDKLMKEQE